MFGNNKNKLPSIEYKAIREGLSTISTYTKMSSQVITDINYDSLDERHKEYVEFIEKNYNTVLYRKLAQRKWNNVSEYEIGSLVYYILLVIQAFKKQEAMMPGMLKARILQLEALLEVSKRQFKRMYPDADLLYYVQNDVEPLSEATNPDKKILPEGVDENLIEMAEKIYELMEGYSYVLSMNAPNKAIAGLIDPFVVGCVLGLLEYTGAGTAEKERQAIRFVTAEKLENNNLKDEFLRVVDGWQERAYKIVDMCAGVAIDRDRKDLQGIRIAECKAIGHMVHSLFDLDEVDSELMFHSFSFSELVIKEYEQNYAKRMQR